MYHECNLVHGDLSEYNLLWHEEKAVIIDVSQSVEHAHPYAADFLKKDISNINDFFEKQSVYTLSNYRLFVFITSPWADLLGQCGLTALPAVSISPGNAAPPISTTAPTTAPFPTKEEMSIALERLREKQREEESRLVTEENKVSDSKISEAVFMQAYIPTSLNEFTNPMREKDRLDKGGREEAFSDAIARMLGGAPVPVTAPIPIGDNQSAAQSPPSSCLSPPRVCDDDDTPLLGSEGGEEGKHATINATENIIKRVSRSDGEESDTGSDRGSDDDADTGSEEYSDEDGRQGGKYRRRLPDAADQQDARRAAKEERKQSRKMSKEAAALKRTQKIPKHVKKRSVKTNKKK